MTHLILVIGLVVFLMTIPFFMYYTYQLVLIDAKSRGIAKPKCWAIFASSSQNGAGILFYLFKKRGTTSQLSDTELAQVTKFKRNMYLLFGVDILFFIIVFIVFLISFS